MKGHIFLYQSFKCPHLVVRDKLQGTTKVTNMLVYTYTVLVRVACYFNILYNYAPKLDKVCL